MDKTIQELNGWLTEFAHFIDPAPPMNFDSWFMQLIS